MTAALPYAHGVPPLTATLRREPGDFQVEELLGFEASGEGEHAFLLIEKSGANTEWVARRLADIAGVAPAAVGYAGLKDRHAVTRQAFTVQLPGRADPDWGSADIPGVRVLAASRHQRKLKRGAHRGNRFRIRLRAVQGSRDAAEARLQAIGAHGVPNYFGEQRFGHGGRNVALAHALFAGRRMPREQRGLALSAARSALFNALLALRVADGSWRQPLEGEVWMLDGSHAIFGPQACDDVLAARFAGGDIDPTGPLWGKGDLRTTAAVRERELAAIAAHMDLAHGLERAGLGQERRPLRLRAADLAHAWESPDCLVAEFRLGAGAYATSVLRELCDWHAGMAPDA